MIALLVDRSMPGSDLRRGPGGEDDVRLASSSRVAVLACDLHLAGRA